MRSSEQIATEIEFYDFASSHGGDILQPQECQPGTVYWGAAERGATSEIAACIGKACGLTIFEGIVYEQGGWQLATTHHTTDNPRYASYVPFTAIGPDPYTNRQVSESGRIAWYQSLLEDMYTLRLDWLQDERMPAKFKQLDALAYTIHDDKSALLHLQRTASQYALTR
jgi:hypothetical protein